MSEIVYLHYIALFLGFGGAFISATLMAFVGKKETRRYRLGKIARRISIVTWIGVALLFISGIWITGQYWVELSKPMLVGKCFAFAIIIGDALIIHLRLFPRYFQEIGGEDFDSIYRKMKLIGALSITCWIAAIILGFFLQIQILGD